MKNLLKKAVIFAVAGIMALSVEAQEEKGVQFTVSGDFVSSYVWRGIYQGAQACVQPTLGVGLGGFSLTAWGSTSLADVEAGHKELDGRLFCGGIYLSDCRSLVGRTRK